MPTNLLVDPSFETQDPAWVLSGEASYTTDLAYDGSYSVRLSPSKTSFGPPPRAKSGYVWQYFATTPGSLYVLSGWFYLESEMPTDDRLTIQVDYGDGQWSYLQTISGTLGVWVLGNLGTIQATGAITGIRIAARAPATDGSYSWLIDLFAAELGAGVSDMAVMMAELPLRAMMATLQSFLNTEIAYIDSEAADSLGLPTVTHWYCWDRVMPSPDETECEVFVVPGTVIFPYFVQDLSAWTSGQRTSLKHTVTIGVRINHANRDALKVSQLQIRGWRYAAAIMRVVRNVPQLGQAAIMCVPGSPSVYVRGAEEGRPIAQIVTAEMSFTCDAFETATGETQAGGGTRPSATLES